MDFLVKNKRFLAINKPVGVPAEKDPTGDDDAITLSSAKLRMEAENEKLWLVHRLDRVVGGILLFARDKDSAAKLSAIFSEHKAEKEYMAVVCKDACGGVLTDFIYKYSSLGKAFVTDRKRNGVKDASLEYVPLQKVEKGEDVYTLVKIKLHTGRFHQIRVQFASRGMPLIGDGKYGSRDKGSRFPALFAYHLGFEFLGQREDIYQYPPHDDYPWCLFDKSHFQ